MDDQWDAFLNSEGVKYDAREWRLVPFFIFAACPVGFLLLILSLGVDGRYDAIITTREFSRRP